MSKKQVKIKLWLPLMILMIFNMLILIISASTSLARYEASTGKTLTFTYQAVADQIHLLNGEKDVNGSVIMAEDGSFRNLGTWVLNTDEKGQVIDNSYVLDFILANGTNKSNACSYDQYAGLVVFTSLGVENPENIDVVLNSGNLEFKATATEVKEGTAIYSKYGPGWIFTFSNKSNEELVFNLPGGVLSYKDLRLTVTGAGAENASISLIATSGTSLTHNINNDSWSVQLNEAEEKALSVSSDLLTENGRTVILKSATENMEIPVTVSAENVSEGEKISCTAEVIIEDAMAEWITATVDSESFEITEDGEKSIKLTLNVNKSIEKDGIITERASDVKAKLKLNFGEKELSADFLIPLTDKIDDDTAGELSLCPSQYNTSNKITIKAGEDDCSITLGTASFPAKTEYIINNESYLLYEDGSIYLNANEQAEIDLSETSLNTAINIVTNGENTYQIEYVENPVINESEQPIITGSSGKTISVPYVWGKINPTIKCYQLTSEKKDNASVLNWTEVTTINVTADASGGIKIVPANAAAGSYKLSISWVENDITLHSMEIPFFIQYESVNQGGTGQ